MARVYHDDTIVARATPIGEGALAVIRVSGANTIAVISSIFKGKSDIAEAAGYTAHFGKLVGPGGNHIDDVIATVFRKPHSYTGEDLIEISCHGGIYISQLVIDSIVSAGARQAEPGEFTKRAFLNGKMDLSQAEAVADLISSRSESSRRISLSQLEGKFSKKISEIRSSLLDICSLLELELDFSEEGIDLIPRTDVIERIRTLLLELEEMASSYSTGKICRDGLSVVIIGKPNAGKSSIFNSLLAEKRAIVTDIPGTTRDSLEESISIDGVLVRLHDTAGLRETTDPVEQEGVARARSALATADVVLLVVDSVSDNGREGALQFLDSVGNFERVLIAYNKIDISNSERINTEKFNHRKSCVDEVLVSARTGEGMGAVRAKLLAAVTSGKIEADSVQLANSRHRDAMVQAINSLKSVSDSLQKGLSGDFAAMDIRRATDALAEIVGEISTEEMLNSIFSRFCIGK